MRKVLLNPLTAAIAISAAFFVIVPLIEMTPLSFHISAPPHLSPLYVLAGAVVAYVALCWVIVRFASLLSQNQGG